MLTRLTEIREAAGMNMKQFADALSIKYTTYVGYENGSREPGSDFLSLVAKTFNVTTDYILGLTDESSSGRTCILEQGEYEHIKKLRTLDDQGRGAVEAILEYETTRARKPIPMLDMMVYTFPAAAGVPLYAESAFEHQEFPASQVPRGADFGVRISGDSMEPTIHNGQIAWVRKAAELQSGQIGVFMIDDSSVCKRFTQKAGVVTLLSDNAAYPPIVVKDFQRFGIVGKVLEQR